MENKTDCKREGDVCWERDKTLSHISAEMDKSEGWAFFSKKIIGDQMQTCVLAKDKMEALYCVMHWLNSEPELWDVLKETIDKSGLAK